MIKQLPFFLALLVIPVLNVQSQRISLNELTTLSSKKTWEDVNQFLMAKGWTYYESEKGNSSQYNTITWSFEKEDYNDKAQAWFYLFTYEGLPNKVSYSVFNKESYSLIQNSLAGAGFKLVNSEIEDNELISTYANTSFILKISTSKREDDDYSNRSLTSYNVVVIKKSGVYDSDNGIKRRFYSDGSIELEYTLVNGKLDGPTKVFYPSGALQKTSYFKNDIENGLTKLYLEDGSLDEEFWIVDGKKHGTFKSYFYDSEGSLYIQEEGKFKEGEKDGLWTVKYVGDKNERLLVFHNYVDGIKNGDFQDVEGDSLILGSYKNGTLHGNYKLYKDLMSSIFGGLINTDISALDLLQEGQYFMGKKSGEWKNYDIAGTLRSRGDYFNDEKNGEWKYYYANVINDDDSPKLYAKKLYLIETYKNGQLHGKTEQYSSLNFEVVPCPMEEKEVLSTDTCKDYVFERFTINANYAFDELHGSFEYLDSTNKTILKGQFEKGNKEGEWLEGTLHETEDDRYFHLFEKGKYRQGKREGQWIKFFLPDQTLETYNYKDGQLDGSYVEWNDQNKPKVKKTFLNGLLKEYIRYDSLSAHPQLRYEILSELKDGFEVKRTQYTDNGSESQVYWLVENLAENNHEIIEAIIEFNLIIPTNKITATGKYLLADQENRTLISGTKFKNDSVDLWTEYFYDQKVKIESNYDHGKKLNETYLNLDGELFSGKFNNELIDIKVTEIKRIKKGIPSGNSNYVDISTGQKLKAEIVSERLLEHEQDSRLNKNSSLFSEPASKQENTTSSVPKSRSNQKTSNSSDGKIYTVVDENPEFPGGEIELLQYLDQNTRYPTIAKDAGIQGIVYLQFVIMKNGTIDDNSITILREVHPALDSEAVRVVKGMPNWTPGKINGEPVPVYYKLPFRFTVYR